MSQNLLEIFNNAGNLDKKSASFLAKALHKNNLDGFDYIEFKQSLQKLEGISKDEINAIQSAFVTASTIGLSKEKLIGSAEHYKKVLLKEKSQFNDALENQISMRISKRKQQIETLKVKSKELKKKIASLEAKIQKYNEHAEKAQSELSSADEKIKKTKLNFEQAYSTILSEIESDIETFKKSL